MEQKKWIGVLSTGGGIFVQRDLGQDLDNNVSVVDSTESFKANDKDEALAQAKKRLRR